MQMFSHMSADGPALSLSDIMHTMSPSPAPHPPLPFDAPPFPLAQFDHSAFLGPPLDHLFQRPFSDEPLAHAEIESMRYRLHQLGLVGPEAANAVVTGTERELVDMVLRLTSDAFLQPYLVQLASQAETIAALINQRNFLLSEREEEYARWQAERDGWERTAEALLARRRAALVGTEKEYERERHIARLQDDNRALRHKIIETNTRLSTLESELNRLRPVLLVQPSLLRDPTLLDVPGLFPWSTHDRTDIKKAKKKGKKEGEEEEKDREAGAFALAQSVAQNLDKAQAAQRADDNVVPPATSTDNNTRDQLQIIHVAPRDEGEDDDTDDLPVILVDPSKPHNGYIKPTRKKKVKVKKNKKGRGTLPDHGTPLLSDARAECLLLAARKIGRMRATIIANAAKEREMQRVRELETEKERARRAADRRARNSDRESGSEMEHQPQFQYVAYQPPAPSSGGVPHPTASGSAAGAAQMHARPVHLPSHFHPTIQQAYSQMLPHSPHNIPTQFVFVPHIAPGTSVGTTRGAPGVPILFPAWPIPGTPVGIHSSPTYTPMRNGASTQYMTTPMDSLVSAARSMMDNEDEDLSDGGPQSHTAATASHEGSPVPKKQRTAGAAGPKTRASLRLQKSLLAEQGKGKGKEREVPTDSETESAEQPTFHAAPLARTRVRSALDVLADQAAQEHGRWPSARSATTQSLELKKMQAVQPASRRREDATGSPSDGAGITKSLTGRFARPPSAVLTPVNKPRRGNRSRTTRNKPAQRDKSESEERDEPESEEMSDCAVTPIRSTLPHRSNSRATAEERTSRREPQKLGTQQSGLVRRSSSPMDDSPSVSVAPSTGEDEDVPVPDDEDVDMDAPASARGDSDVEQGSFSVDTSQK